jgi:prepilin-type N-terminal cleavage/methylation domain-containing protein
MKHPRQATAGFTLLEVMVALTLLAVGIVGVLTLFPQSLRQSRTAQERTSVASLARTELGRVRTGGVGDPISEWAIRNAFRELTEAQRAYSLYESWRASVTRIGGDVDLFRVTFSVQMFDGREEQFVTYITQR